MPTIDAILAAAFLWGLVLTAAWLLMRYVLRWGWVIPVTLVVVTLIFLTAAMLS